MKNKQLTPFNKYKCNIYGFTYKIHFINMYRLAQLCNPKLTDTTEFPVNDDPRKTRGYTFSTILYKGIGLLRC